MQCSQCGQATEERLVHVKRGIAWGLVGVGLALAWQLGGGLLHDLVEGQRRDILPLWEAFVPLAVLLLSVIVGFARWRQPVCAKCEIATPGSDCTDTIGRCPVSSRGGCSITISIACLTVDACRPRATAWTCIH